MWELGCMAIYHFQFMGNYTRKNGFTLLYNVVVFYKCVVVFSDITVSEK